MGDVYACRGARACIRHTARTPGGELMAATLRSLAGEQMFNVADVISTLHNPLPAGEVVLDRYVFLPHARTGIAAALSAPFGWNLPIQATVEMRVPVIDD